MSAIGGEGLHMSWLTNAIEWIKHMGRGKTSREDLLTHLHTQVFARLSASEIHGVGVFSVRDIPKGVNPFKIMRPDEYEYYTEEELKTVPVGVMKLIDQFCYCVDGVYEVPKAGFNTMNLAVYLNHSKTPNLKMIDEGEFEALFDIPPGVELTMDYDDSFNDEHVFDESSEQSKA
jgi:hypothetical protein